MPTELAYLTDIAAGYARRFTARVVARPPGAIVLDRTLFYPTGGGQPSDRGTLISATGGEVPVIDVRREGLLVVHRFSPGASAARELTVGSTVEGVLDWERRYRHMRLHSGQHLLSGLLFARTGRRTVRATLAYPRASVVLDGPLSGAESREVDGALQEAIEARRAVTIHWVPRAEWDKDPSGRASGIPLAPGIDPVRIIEIEGVDRCPCGGTHLRSTSEIGRVTLISRSESGDTWELTLSDAATPTPPE